MSRPIHILELRSVRGTGGGPEKTILLGAARADSRRFRVTVCYVRDDRDKVFSLDLRARRLGVDYVEIHERHSIDPRIWPALRALIRERRIDIVHAHEYKTDLLALLLARAEGVIPLATVHGWSGNSLRERFYYTVDRRLLARYPMVIAVSEAIRRTLIRYGASPDRVYRLSNGIDEAHFQPNPAGRAAIRERLLIPAHSQVIGAVGRLEGEKRFDLLVDAASRLRNRDNVTVVIAGAGSWRPRLEKLASDRGIRLHLTGHCDDVREIYPAFDVYVQTSATEGVPNAVLEAMAMEIPVVATLVGGTPELIRDGEHGLLVPAGDVKAIASAIERTISDVSAAQARVSAARARVEAELSFSARMRALESIYERLVAAHPLRHPNDGDVRCA